MHPSHQLWNWFYCLYLWEVTIHSWEFTLQRATVRGQTSEFIIMQSCWYAFVRIPALYLNFKHSIYMWPFSPRLWSISRQLLLRAWTLCRRFPWSYVTGFWESSFSKQKSQEIKEIQETQEEIPIVSWWETSHTSKYFKVRFDLERN